MKKLILGIIAAFTLVSCATTEKYEKVLNTWIGATELDLVRKWGAPQKTYEVSNKKFIVYHNSRTAYIPGQQPSYVTQRDFLGNYTTTSTGGYGGYNVTYTCTTTFEFDKGKVSSWSWEGNACKAK